MYSGVQVTVIDDTNAITFGSAGYLVKMVWPIVITSPKNGDTLSSRSRPTIRMSPAGRKTFSDFEDKYTVYIDGKYYHDVPSDTIYWLAPSPGTHTLEVVRTFADVELVRSATITVNIK